MTSRRNRTARCGLLLYGAWSSAHISGCSAVQHGAAVTLKQGAFLEAEPGPRVAGTDHEADKSPEAVVKEDVRLDSPWTPRGAPPPPPVRRYRDIPADAAAGPGPYEYRPNNVLFGFADDPLLGLPSGPYGDDAGYPAAAGRPIPNAGYPATPPHRLKSPDRDQAPIQPAKNKRGPRGPGFGFEEEAGVAAAGGAAGAGGGADVRIPPAPEFFEAPEPDYDPEMAARGVRTPGLEERRSAERRAARERAGSSAESEDEDVTAPRSLFDPFGLVAESTESGASGLVFCNPCHAKAVPPGAADARIFVGNGVPAAALARMQDGDWTRPFLNELEAVIYGDWFAQTFGAVPRKGRGRAAALTKDLFSPSPQEVEDEDDNAMNVDAGGPGQEPTPMDTTSSVEGSLESGASERPYRPPPPPPTLAQTFPHRYLPLFEPYARIFKENFKAKWIQYFGEAAWEAVQDGHSEEREAFEAGMVPNAIPLKIRTAGAAEDGSSPSEGLGGGDTTTSAASGSPTRVISAPTIQINGALRQNEPPPDEAAASPEHKRARTTTAEGGASTTATTRQTKERIPPKHIYMTIAAMEAVWNFYRDVYGRELVDASGNAVGSKRMIQLARCGKYPDYATPAWKNRDDGTGQLLVEKPIELTHQQDLMDGVVAVVAFRLKTSFAYFIERYGKAELKVNTEAEGGLHVSPNPRNRWGRSITLTSVGESSPEDDRLSQSPAASAVRPRGLSMAPGSSRHSTPASPPSSGQSGNSGSSGRGPQPSSTSKYSIALGEVASYSLGYNMASHKWGAAELSAIGGLKGMRDASQLEARNPGNQNPNPFKDNTFVCLYCNSQWAMFHELMTKCKLNPPPTEAGIDYYQDAPELFSMFENLSAFSSANYVMGYWDFETNLAVEQVPAFPTVPAQTEGQGRGPARRDPLAYPPQENVFVNPLTSMWVVAELKAAVASQLRHKDELPGGVTLAFANARQYGAPDFAMAYWKLHSSGDAIAPVGRQEDPPGGATLVPMQLGGAVGGHEDIFALPNSAAATVRNTERFISRVSSTDPARRVLFEDGADAVARDAAAARREQEEERRLHIRRVLAHTEEHIFKAAAHEVRSRSSPDLSVHIIPALPLRRRNGRRTLEESKRAWAATERRNAEWAITYGSVLADRTPFVWDSPMSTSGRTSPPRLAQQYGHVANPPPRPQLVCGRVGGPAVNLCSGGGREEEEKYDYFLQVLHYALMRTYSATVEREIGPERLKLLAPGNEPLLFFDWTPRSEESVAEAEGREADRYRLVGGSGTPDADRGTVVNDEFLRKLKAEAEDRQRELRARNFHTLRFLSTDTTGTRMPKGPPGRERTGSGTTI